MAKCKRVCVCVCVCLPIGRRRRRLQMDDVVLGGMKDAWRRRSQPTVQGHVRVVLSAWREEREKREAGRLKSAVNNTHTHKHARTLTHPLSVPHTLTHAQAPTQTALTKQTLQLTRLVERRWENGLIVLPLATLSPTGTLICLARPRSHVSQTAASSLPPLPPPHPSWTVCQGRSSYDVGRVGPLVENN